MCKKIPLDIDGEKKTILLDTTKNPTDLKVIDFKIDVLLIKRYGMIGADSKNYMNVNLHPDKIFVFGDNLIRKGRAGQAVIRYAKNSFGIATKRIPSMNKGSFFTDQEDEFSIVRTDLRNLYKLGLSGKTIVFPSDGLGTGMGNIKDTSPKIYSYMNNILKKHFNI